MSKVRVKLVLDHPTIIVQLTPDGLKVTLEAWQHNAPVGQLAWLDARVAQTIHQWRNKFLQRQAEFNTPNVRQRDAAEEKQAERRAT